MKGKNQEGSAKEKMLAIASILFWKNGYGGTTMRSIAKAYKCKPANIYNFFPNKEAILFEFLYKQANLIVSKIEHLENDKGMNPMEQLRFLISTHLKQTLSYSKTSRSLFDTGVNSLSQSNRKKVIALRDRYDQILSKIIQRGIDDGQFAKTDVRLAAFNIASMIVRTIIWFSPEGRLSIDQVEDFIFNFILNGLKNHEDKMSQTPPAERAG